MTTIITTFDLRLPENKNKFSIESLIQNINCLDKKTLLHTQVLTAEFCVKYILSMDDEDESEDSYLLCEDYILECQPHISEDELLTVRNKYYYKYFA